MYEKVLKNPENFDFKVQQLGEQTHPNPSDQGIFVSEEERIAFSSQINNLKSQFNSCEELPGFEKAGARKTLFHNPKNTKAALITCGGLCPGLNNVIKSLVTVLEKDYKVNEIIGIRYGYKGLAKSSNLEPIQLNSEAVDQIHKQGGTTGEGDSYLFCIEVALSIRIPRRP